MTTTAASIRAGEAHANGPPTHACGPGVVAAGQGSARRGRGRARRGDIRAALLTLLAERPMNGYEMIGELESRTHGVWRPSPGSIYPTLQALEDEGLVRSSESGGKRAFELTEAGQEAQQGERPTGPRPVGGHERRDLRCRPHTPRRAGPRHDGDPPGGRRRHRGAQGESRRRCSWKLAASCTPSSPRPE